MSVLADAAVISAGVAGLTALTNTAISKLGDFSLLRRQGAFAQGNSPAVRSALQTFVENKGYERYLSNNAFNSNSIISDNPGAYALYSGFDKLPEGSAATFYLPRKLYTGGVRKDAVAFMDLSTARPDGSAVSRLYNVPMDALGLPRHALEDRASSSHTDRVAAHIRKVLGRAGDVFGP